MIKKIESLIIHLIINPWQHTHKGTKIPEEDETKRKKIKKNLNHVSSSPSCVPFPSQKEIMTACMSQTGFFSSLPTYHISPTLIHIATPDFRQTI